MNILGVAIVVIYIITLVYHQVKELPSELNYESSEYSLFDEETQLLSDITINSEGDEPIREHEIFDAFNNVIQNAEKFIVLDMFMFTDLGAAKDDYPPISKDLELVISDQMEKYPALDVWIITDPINTSYGSHEASRIEALEEQGAHVIYANLDPLRDPIPIYTSFYRMFLQWFGESGGQWFPNYFGSQEPDISLGSYFKTFNIKSNHRKALITENEGIYSSANAHDASAYHSNIGVRVRGTILEAMLEAERRVVSYSGGNVENFPSPDQLKIEERPEEEELIAKVVTDGTVFEEALKIIEDSKEGEEIWLGMYLFSEADIIEAMENAADRGVLVRIILDPNQTSFGKEKPGIPNIAVTHSMNISERENLEVRWYNVDKGQYHSKILFLKGNESKVLLGSINYSRRSLGKYSLQNNMFIRGPGETEFMQEVSSYFERLWNNPDHKYTLDYGEYQDSLSWFRRLLFRIQKTLWLTTF